jgi:phosphatidylinositol-bisphosphatase
MIEQALDTGDEFVLQDSSLWGEDEVTLAFGETLVHFLDSLIEPVVPSNVHPLIANLEIEHEGEVREITAAFPITDET